MVIPMTRHRDHYELPLWMFKVARDVLQDATWYSLGLEAVRGEILERLSDNHDYAPDPDFMSLQFLTDLRSSLNHPVDARRPWSYPRADDESSEETSLSSDNSSPGPTVEQQGQMETALGTAEQQECPRQGEDDSASDFSMASFHSAQEQTGSNKSRGEDTSKEANSAWSSNSSQATAQLPSGSPGSSDSGLSDRHFKFLSVTYEYLKLQLELLKLQSESRKLQKAKKKAQKKLRGVTQLSQARTDTDNNRSGCSEPQASEIEGHRNESPQPSNLRERAPKVQSHATSEQDDLDSLFGSEEE
jgi:hypothetical protein